MREIDRRGLEYRHVPTTADFRGAHEQPLSSSPGCEFRPIVEVQASIFGRRADTGPIGSWKSFRVRPPRSRTVRGGSCSCHRRACFPHFENGEQRLRIGSNRSVSSCLQCAEEQPSALLQLRPLTCDHASIQRLPPRRHPVSSAATMRMIRAKAWLRPPPTPPIRRLRRPLARGFAACRRRCSSSPSKRRRVLPP